MKNNLNTRGRAALAVRDVVILKRSLDDVIGRYSRGLDTRNTAFFREMTYGTVRWYVLLNAINKSLMQKPVRQRDSDIAALIAVGVYQLKFMQVDDHAAVAETVAACKALKKTWAKSLVNAVLRRFQREQEMLSSNTFKPAIKHAMPDWLFQHIQRAWPQQAHSICASLNEKPPLCLRINTRRITREEYLQKLDQKGIQATQSKQSPCGVIIDPAVAIERLPGFASGEISVQDDSAQLAAPLLQPLAGERVLDACAAPGGKTTHLLEIEPTLHITAVDKTDRLPPLRQNLKRLGLTAKVIAGDAAKPVKWWDGKPFDRILLDVPCTGSGVIRRKPDIKFRRQKADINRFRQTQIALFEACWGMLASAGKLLYTTCSIFPEENEQIIQLIMDGYPDAQPIQLPAGLGIRCIYGVQRLPGVHHSDGFYYALLSKKP